MAITAIKRENSDTFWGTNNQNRLTYSSIGKKKSAFVRINQPLIEGFTPHQQAEFDRGITIENYAKKKGINL